MKALATASLILCLGAAPAIAAEPAVTAQTFDGWFTRDTVSIVKAAVEAEACGVRSSEWANHVVLAVAFESGKIAGTLWPPYAPGIISSGANHHINTLLAQIATVISQKHRASDPADCRRLEASHALTQINGILLEAAQDRYGDSVVAADGGVR